jgi:hypothetical protein
MLWPPLNVVNIERVTATPSPATEHRLSGGQGLRVVTPNGATVFISDNDGSVRMVSTAQADREYNVTTGGEATVDDFLSLVNLPRQTDLDPEAVLGLAADLLEGFRWRPADGPEHNPAERRTYILNALRDPTGFLIALQAGEDIEEEKEAEKEEEVKVETEIPEELLRADEVAPAEVTVPTVAVIETTADAEQPDDGVTV